MSKSQPSRAEARWRANHRCRRMRANLLDEASIGDPLGVAEDAWRAGMMAKLALAIIATARRPEPSAITKLRAITTDPGRNAR